MNWKNLKAPFKALVIIAICAVSLWQALPVQKKIHLGLDLQGGARLLLQLYPTAEVPQITTQVQAQTREVIDRRINGLGVAEPSISNIGSDRILVELPNVKNPDQAEQVLKQVAVLEYKIVPMDVMQKADAANSLLQQPNLNAKTKADAELYVSKTAYEKSGDVVYSGKDLKAAQASYDQAGFLKLAPGASHTVKGRSIYLTLSGSGEIDGQPMRKLTALYLALGESATITAREDTELMHFGLPNLAGLRMPEHDELPAQAAE